MSLLNLLSNGIELCLTDKSYGVSVLIIGVLTMVLFQDNITVITAGKLLVIFGAFCTVSSVLKLTRSSQNIYR